MADLYIFIDESGNFDFSPQGTRYFILSAVVTDDPKQGVAELLAVRHKILSSVTPSNIRKPRDCTHFHCTEDDQSTRDAVFAEIAKMRAATFSVIVEKNKTNPAIRKTDVFYERVFRTLVPYIIRNYGSGFDINIFVSEIGVASKKAAFIGALKATLNAAVGVTTYRLHFHPTHSHHMLQVSDYICWAIARKWERGDLRSYKLVSAQVATEFDMFARGVTRYY